MLPLNCPAAVSAKPVNNADLYRYCLRWRLASIATSGAGRIQSNGRPMATARGPETINRDRSMMLSYITISPDCQAKNARPLLDDLVGAGEEHRRYVDPRGLRGPEIDD